MLGVDNSVQLLTRVTAAGCALTALIAAFLAAAPAAGAGALEATAAALAVFGWAGGGGGGSVAPGGFGVAPLLFWQGVE